MHKLLPARADPAADPAADSAANPAAAAAEGCNLLLRQHVRRRRALQQQPVHGPAAVAADDCILLLLRQQLRKRRVLQQQTMHRALRRVVSVPLQSVLHCRRRMRERLRRSLPVPGPV